MKRKYIIFILIIILTGCSSEYNIEFSNKKIKENIKVDILNSDILPKYDVKIYGSTDKATSFIKNDQYPFFGNEDIVYNKKVDKSGNVTHVELNYEYTHDEYLNSTAYKGCFENSELVTNKKNYNLNFYGSFYCLYGDELVINIKSNNEVISNNADKVNGNVYTWIINKDNVDNVNIQMKISKHTIYFKMIIYAIIGVLFIGLIISGYIVYKRYRERDSVNDI